MDDDWRTMTACALGRGIEDGGINPVELAEAFLETAGAHPLCDRIYARLTQTRARAEALAAAARAKAGLRRGPLDGVPVSWKDLFDSAGTATEAGSAMLRGRTPDRDAALLANATQGGLVCLGKTHMSELAFSGLGLNPVTATPPCINDEAAVAGGSSSGAAASVAFGLAAAGIGTDTGGSVRIPAAWNDLVGLKTTHGLLPLTGALPLCERFDSAGPLARSVEDCAALLGALSGGAVPDLRGAQLGGMRLWVLETTALDDLRTAPAAAFEAAVDRLAAAGARIDHIRAPEVTEAMSLAGVLYSAEAYGIWSAEIEANPDVMFPRILERFRTGALVRAADYVAAWRRLYELRALWESRIAGCDAVLVPTSAILPPDAVRLMSDADFYMAENLLALRNTRIANLMGGAALTLPTGRPSCGISLMAGAGQDARLLRLGLACERALA